MKYFFVTIFLIFSFITLVGAIGEKNETIRINFSFLSAFNASLAFLSYLLI